MTDTVTMLRNYAGLARTGAFERSIMLEAADKLERYQEKETMDIPLKQKLKEDKNAMYDAMCRIGENSEIWQDQTIYAMCKAIHDIITKLEKEGAKNVSE